MSDTAIKVENVSRMYRRFRHSRYRVLELLGVKAPKSSYDEFWALRDISFSVKRGERVALIGRNGAGKSTLLSIVCGRLQPTDGSVRVAGQIQALMELGTGFHPEFTARQNVFASLAYHGVTGRRAAALLDEIIDFAELEDFIDQPVKTFSAGMYTRLAFSTATAIEPDILIIDEVLGAGDAYFAAKSAERMKRLTVESGATVLFVSHDMSSVERLCERAIWIERGRVHMEGTALEVSKAYYASVMKQEEERLRRETARILARQRQSRDNMAKEVGSAFIQLRAAGIDAPAVPIRKIALRTDQPRYMEVRPGEPMDNDTSQPAYLLASVQDTTAWSAPLQYGQEMVRSVQPNSSTSSGIAGFQDVADMLEHALSVEIEHGHLGEANVKVEILLGPEKFDIGLLTSREADEGPWRTDHFTWKRPDFDSESGVDKLSSTGGNESAFHLNASDHWNTETGAFLELATCDAETRADKNIFARGEDIVLKVKIGLAKRVPEFWFVMILYSDKGERLAMEATHFPSGADSGEHEISARIKHPNLRQGEYNLSLEVLPQFTLNWGGGTRLPFICHVDRAVFFKVNEDYTGTIDLGITKQNIEVTLAPNSSILSRE
ncbi:polysaccharide ABC transporter ATP-binding protein [Paraburkholderia sp. GAS334]|uniref:ABC transporter ATP-binding protein n=1 Tax=Paraburkholderia sp. GAS334 TaxID=3035131 RepID=UPI003D1F3DE6